MVPVGHLWHPLLERQWAGGDHITEETKGQVLEAWLADLAQPGQSGPLNVRIVTWNICAGT